MVSGKTILTSEALPTWHQRSSPAPLIPAAALSFIEVSILNQFLFAQSTVHFYCHFHFQINEAKELLTKTGGGPMGGM